MSPLDVPVSWWAFLNPARCLPDHCNGEPLRAGWIAQPYAFWSSLAYFAFAFLAIRRGGALTREARLWFGCLIGVGFTSFFAHASMTEWAIALDLSAIATLLLCLPVHRRMKGGSPAALFVFWALTGLALKGQSPFVTVGTCLLAFGVAFLDLWRDHRARLRESRFLGALILITAGFCVFVADDFRWYNPESDLLKGHTIWHGLSALSLYQFSIWYFGPRSLRQG
ncbi:MAG: hypothetical protein EBX52_10155 [Proteobacteria bacterium]|nr:hypothetical protein [Pseudomonadota bacterium]